MSELKDKVAVITGASSGIGYATARLLVARGARVVATGRNEANLERLRAECVAGHPDASVLVVVGDVTVEADVERVVSTAVGHFGRLDVLVNNAGMANYGGIQDTTLAQFDEVMRTNLRSVFHLSMLCVPQLVKTQGCVVNVSSVAGLRAFPTMLSESVSEAGVDQLTRCMALELAPKQVRVNAVNPSLVVTNILKASGMSDAASEGMFAKAKDILPLGRPGMVEEVAEAICFLADGSKSGFMTGNTIPVDGGRHAACPR